MILRPLRQSDDGAALAAHAALAPDNFQFLIGYRDGDDWTGYLARLEDERLGRNLPPHLVPATFLVAELKGVIVGRTSVRHALNDHLLALGGHIGYGVVPEFRQRGIATEILRQSLVIARAVGVGDVLVTCDEDNAASARTIERCGGALENVVDAGEGAPRKRRYWISPA